MRAILTFSVLITTLLINAQTTLLQKDFEDGSLTSGGWTFSTFTHYYDGYITINESEVINGAKDCKLVPNPDYYMGQRYVSPEIDLSAYDGTKTLTFSFKQLAEEVNQGFYIQVWLSSDNRIYQHNLGFNSFGADLVLNQENEITVDVTDYNYSDAQIEFIIWDTSPNVEEDESIQIDNILFQAYSTSLSVEDIDSENDVVIYPTLVKDKLFIKDNNSSQYSIYDLNGNLITSSKNENGYINLNYLKPGTYIIKINNQNKKFIKL